MKKLISIMILIAVLLTAKYVLFDFVVSSGKRVGNLVKISKKGKILKTWEGTIDEGSGDILTSFFSVNDEALGQQLYDYEGKQVVVYYDEHLLGFPHDTKYNVTSWKPQDGSEKQLAMAHNVSFDDQLVKKVEATLFCSLLGAIRSNRQLYLQVKEHIKNNNHFLYQKYEICNN